MKTCQIRAVLAAIFLAVIPSLQAAAVESSCFPLAPEPAIFELAVSLKQAQADLARCGTICPAEIVSLHNLGRIDGYVIDQQNHDIVLFGPKVKPGHPAQKLDNLVIALRSAAVRYFEIKGNTRYITAPGVTLNPRRENIAALQRIASRAGSAGNWIDDFCLECRKKQDLLVLGIPFDTSAAQIMAVADHTLKKVANSDLPIMVPEFESLATRRRREAEQKLTEGRVFAAASMYRLWFYPGQVTYQEDESGMSLDRADVLVRQQHQITDASGNYRDGGDTDPVTAQWTCDVTRLYRDIASQAPDSGFDGLAKLLRVFSVAKLMVSHNAAKASGLTLDYFLDKHVIKPVKVDHQWGGVAHVEHIERRGEDGRRRWTTIVDMPMCGGVEFDLDENTNLTSVPDRGHFTQAIAKSVLASRPTPNASSWPVRPI
jgi:hypothetical protein